MNLDRNRTVTEIMNIRVCEHVYIHDYFRWINSYLFVHVHLHGGSLESWDQSLIKIHIYSNIYEYKCKHIYDYIYRQRHRVKDNIYMNMYVYIHVYIYAYVYVYIYINVIKFKMNVKLKKSKNSNQINILKSRIKN